MDSSIRDLDLLVLSFVLGELSFGLGDVAAVTTATDGCCGIPSSTLILSIAISSNDWKKEAAAPPSRAAPRAAVARAVCRGQAEDQAPVGWDGPHDVQTGDGSSVGV